MRYDPWRVDSPEDVPKVYGAWLDEQAEKHDRYGTLQGWYFLQDPTIGYYRLYLVFQHAIIQYSHPECAPNSYSEITRLDDFKRPLPLVCPECGGELQATCSQHTYFTLEDGQWIYMSHLREDSSETRFYCENDHYLPADLLKRLPPLPSCPPPTA